MLKGSIAKLDVAGEKAYKGKGGVLGPSSNLVHPKAQPTPNTIKVSSVPMGKRIAVGVCGIVPFFPTFKLVPPIGRCLGHLFWTYDVQRHYVPDLLGYPEKDPTHDLPYRAFVAHRLPPNVKGQVQLVSFFLKDPLEILSVPFVSGYIY
jgi:hypothetical protein